MTNQCQNLCDTALQLTQNRMSVIPIGRNKLPYASLLPIETDEDGRPVLDAKGQPKHTWNPYRKRLATLDEIEEWFGPARYIAIIGGFDGLEILDFDNHKNAGITGRIIGLVYPRWAELVKSQRPELFTKLVINTTPSEGYHVKYRYLTESYDGNQKLAEAYEIDPNTDEIVADERGKPKKVTLIETRGEGGYAVSPPSPGYKMVQGDLTTIPTITKEERNFLITVARSFHVIENDTHQSQYRGSETTSSDDGLRPGDDFNQRGDHVSLLEGDGWILDHECSGVEYWRRPGKDVGWSATWGHIPNRFYVFSSNASPFENNRTYDRFSIYAFLKHDGDFEAAAKKLAAQGYGEKRASTQNGSGRTSPTTGEIRFTDGWNAKRFVEEHGDDVHYCHEWGKWLIWDGKRWVIDRTGEVKRRAKQTVRGMYAQAANIENDKARKLLVDHAKKSDSNYRYKAMLALAECEVPVLPEQLDADPMLLNCENGTLDLRTGDLREHRRVDLMTKLAPVAYDPDATCEKWFAFLNRIMDFNRNLIKFLQRAVGYALTGDIGEQVLFFLYGTGANGKSTFLESVMGMLGEYAKSTEPEILIQKRNEAHPTGVADLMGARLISTVEVGEGRRLNEVKVKQLTGGDTLKARFMRQDFFEFKPTHKVFLAANHKPVIRGTDHAIWRRIRLIPFEVTIPNSEQIPLAEMLDTLKQEWPGILAWAVEGCLAWQQSGLGFPAEVYAATEAYRNEMDIIGDFLDECCVIDENAKAKASALYASYKEWCDTTNERPGTQKVFGGNLTERGFERKRENTGYFWLGIGLLADEGEPSAQRFTASEASHSTAFR